MSEINKSYHALMEKILKQGYIYQDPNRREQNVLRKEIDRVHILHEFKDGFPLITTKNVPYRMVLVELFWFLRGSTDIRELWDEKVHIWDKDWWNYHTRMLPRSPYKTIEEAKNDYHSGQASGPDFDHRFTLGDIYGQKFRDWRGRNGRIDQLTQLIDNIRREPMGSHMVTLFDPTDTTGTQALRPCHWSFEILPKPDRTFKLVWHQRSVDTFLGLPFNFASYGTLALIIGAAVNMKPTAIEADLSRVHIYKDHILAVKKQLEEKPDTYDKVEMHLSSWIEGRLAATSLTFDRVIKGITKRDFHHNNYKKGPAIPANMLAYDH